MTKMVSKKELEFFEQEKIPMDVLDEFGNKSGNAILKEVLEEGFAKLGQDKKMYLTALGKRKLNELKKEEIKKKKNLLLKHPLVTGLILVLVTVFSTYQITLNSIDYENELSVRFLGENKITVPTNKTIPFNRIIIYNPTNKRVSLNDLYVERPPKWIKNQPSTNDGERGDTGPEIVYSVPKLIEDYAPYMVLESGETRLMSGNFYLIAPYKEGNYELNFYVETLDGKKYYTDKKLIINVVEEK